jgi:hypothetical protein
MSKLFSQRIKNLENIFGIFFVKRKKLLEKFEHAGNKFENFEHAVEKKNK